MTDLERVRYERANGTIWYGVEEAILDAHLKEDEAMTRQYSRALKEQERLRYELSVADYPGKQALVEELARLREDLKRTEGERDRREAKMYENADEIDRLREENDELAESRHETLKHAERLGTDLLATRARYTELLEAVRAFINVDWIDEAMAYTDAKYRLRQLIEENDG